MNGYKSRFQRWTRSFILVAGLGLIHLAGCATSRPPVQAGISLQEALSDKEERFREVTPGRSEEHTSELQSV